MNDGHWACFMFFGLFFLYVSVGKKVFRESNKMFILMGVFLVFVRVCLFVSVETFVDYNEKLSWQPSNWK